jgi:hypothetical protein
MDLMIAAHARSRGATLVSNDGRHLKRVEGLLVANWVRGGWLLRAVAGSRSVVAALAAGVALDAVGQLGE